MSNIRVHDLFLVGELLALFVVLPLFFHFFLLQDFGQLALLHAERDHQHIQGVVFQVLLLFALDLFEIFRQLHLLPPEVVDKVQLLIAFMKGRLVGTFRSVTLGLQLKGRVEGGL